MRNEIETLLAELRDYAESARESSAKRIDRADAQWFDGADYGCQLAIDKLDAILTASADDYKRGVVDGMTASANFVAAAHLQGRDNDRMRLADSLRDEAKRVSEEK